MEENKDYTIAEDFELPSKGKVYSVPVNSRIKLRSMTTEDEMKRLGHSERPNELLAEIMDDCLLTKMGIRAYDLCVPDYQFLMYKLRTVTYGPKYTISTVCPICGGISEQVVNLESLAVKEFSDELKSHLNITLPVSGKQIELRMQTPRLLDDVSLKSKQLLEKETDLKGEPAFLYNIISMIAKVDGQVVDDFKLEAFVRKLSMKDVNYIIQNIRAVTFGIDSKITCKCKHCDKSYQTYLPITGEFFGPTTY